MLVVFIVSFSVALVVSAMCSIAESVLMSLSTAELVEISRKNAGIGKIWEDFKSDVNAPITAILTLNTAAHTIGASFAGASFAQLTGDKWIGAFSVVFTFLMLQFTEILPKTLGVRFRRSLAHVIAYPLYWITYLSQPLFYLFRILNLPFESKIGKSASSSLGAVQEIMLLTSLARSRSQLDTEQEKIILATLKLSQTKAEDVMVPISDVSMLSESMSISDALEVGKNDSHTRFPVYYKDDPTIIIGYVNIKELIGREIWSTSEDGRNVRGSGGLASCLRKIIRVEPTAKTSDVLNILVKQHEHIAVVVSSVEQKNLGILTLEDLVEELVGEIEDEFDRLPETTHLSQSYVRVGGGAPVSSVMQSVAKVFPRESQELLKELSKTDVNQRFTRWFETVHPSGVARNDRLDFGELAVWVRRARRDQVFDAQIQRAVSVAPRISVFPTDSVADKVSVSSEHGLATIPDSDSRPTESDSAVGF